MTTIAAGEAPATSDRLDGRQSLLSEPILALAPLNFEPLRNAASMLQAASGGPTFAVRHAPPGGMPYAIQPGGVAMIEVTGILDRKPGFIMRLLGAVSMLDLQESIGTAASDPAVQSILLNIDSPGGSINGPPELAALIRETAATKPVVAITSGTLASAAYWIASACNSVYGTGPTVCVGSIGVMRTHSFTPRTDGGATEEVVAGSFKRIASPLKPLSAEGRAYLQADVNYVHDVFAADVAAGRGMSAQAVKNTEARVYIGQQAITAGLLDGLVSVNALVADMGANPSRYLQKRLRPALGSMAPASGPQGGRTGATAAHGSLGFLARSAVAAEPSPFAPTPGSIQEQRAAAASALTKAFAMHGGNFRLRVATEMQWCAEAETVAARDKCTLSAALAKVGYVHPLVSLPVPYTPVAAPIASPSKPTALAGGSAAAKPQKVEPRYVDSPPFTEREKKEAGQAFAALASKGDGVHRQTTPLRTAEVWNSLASEFSERMGCSFGAALTALGYVHPAISVGLSKR